MQIINNFFKNKTLDKTDCYDVIAQVLELQVTHCNELATSSVDRDAYYKEAAMLIQAMYDKYGKAKVKQQYTQIIQKFVKILSKMENEDLNDLAKQLK